MIRVKDSSIQQAKLEELKQKVIPNMKPSDILSILQCKYKTELKLILKKIHDRTKL